MQKNEKMVTVTVKLPESTVKCMERLIESGVFKNRSVAIRYLVELGLRRMEACV